MKKLLPLLLFITFLFINSFFVHQTHAQTTCSVRPTNINSITTTVSISQTGMYTIWSRILAPDTTNNSYYLQIDGQCPFTVGDSPSISPTTWTWINYQNGVTTTPISVSLTAGTHVVKLTQKEAGVGLDKILFTQNTTCVPTGSGDNCVTQNTPTIAATQTPTVAPINTPTAFVNPTSTVAPIPTTVTTGNIAGYATWNGSFDSGNANMISASQVITGNVSGILHSISIYIGTVHTPPYNTIQVALYADNGEKAPGKLIASSLPRALISNSWNTISTTAVAINPNTKYWLAFNLNGSKTQFGLSNGSGLSTWKNKVLFGTFPKQFGKQNYSNTTKYAIYMNY
jgi:hypothetical protein